MGGYDDDPRIRHRLSSKFSTLMATLGDLLDKCVKVGALKMFLKYYSHPLYPEKRYIEPCVYRKAKKASDVIHKLFPYYINYMQYYLLEEIVDKFGCVECRKCFLNYKEFFQSCIHNLWDHPAPLTDEEIEQSTFQKRLKVTMSGHVDTTRPEDVQTVQGAIEQTSGISRVGQVFAHQDPGNSVTFTFLIPSSMVHLFNELSAEDLTTLANAGITRIHVQGLEITSINKHITKKSFVPQLSSITAERRREQNKPSSLEYYLDERKDLPRQQHSDIVAMLQEIPTKGLSEVCSDQLLLEFSHHIGNWRRLAPFLGMQDFYHDEFTSRYPRRMDQSYQLLLFWKKREKDAATYYNLLETILIHGTIGEVKALIQIPLSGYIIIVWMFV